MAITNLYWRDVNNDFTDTANWSATPTGVTGAGPPSAGASGTNVFVYAGTKDISGHITGVTAVSITIGGTYAGNIIGMTIATASCTVTIENVGFNKSIVIGADAAVTLALMHARKVGLGTCTAICGAAGIITALYVGRVGKQFIVDGSANVTNYRNAGMTSSEEYNATAFTTARYKRGTHTLKRGVTTAVVGGGAIVNTQDSVAFASATIEEGSTINHDSDGTFTALVAEPGGTLNPVATKFAVTDSELWEGCNVNRNSDKISFTNASTLVGNVG